MLACQRCRQTTNGPQAFLLTCRGCSKTWHHRCHMPPVEDGELMQRIRATNQGDTDNNLRAWMCRRCKRNASSVTPSRGSTVSCESHGDQNSLTPSHSPAVTDATSTASRAVPTVDVRVKQERELFTIGCPPLSVPQSQPASAPTPHNVAQNTEAEPASAPKPPHAQPQINQTQPRATPPDDDPEDLYGPPVERRVIRILPSLAEELREQQRRTAAGKEKRRAPLAPDWILARHVHDPLWKEVAPSVGGRKPRKLVARKLEDNGLNISELVGYLTLENSVREHKT